MEKVETVIKEVKSIPVIDVSLIVSVISLILSFVVGIIYFIVGYNTLYTISNYIIALHPQTAEIVNSVAASITGMGFVYLILIWPVMAFFLTFIGTAIVILLYNFLAPRIGGIRLELE
jgi:hypothetical protein